MSAVKELNVKKKNWTDLMTGEAFTKKDIITLQDPSKGQVKMVASDSVARQARETAKKNKESADSLKQSLAAGTGAAPATSHKEAIMRTTGAVAASFTSTGYSVVTEQQKLVKTEASRVYRCPKEDGVVRLKTTHGSVLLRLFASKVPLTCDNFIGLCKRGYYDGVGFHRVIANFMIQGGDPTGTGRGGKSIWGGKFRDEIVRGLRHDKRGVVSMANAGPGTNGSQFFILLAPAQHLDGKHTVFGAMDPSEGEDFLASVEDIPTDGKARPAVDITILSTEIVADPFASLGTEEEEKAKWVAANAAEQAEAKKRAREDEAGKERGQWYSGVGKTPDGANLGVGRFLNLDKRPRTDQ